MLLLHRVFQGFGRVTSREWALLALETLGVLAGILVAFELSEWAQRRNEQALRVQMMERLFEEAQRNVSLMREQRDWFAGITQREKAFATQLVRDGTCPAAVGWEAVTTVMWYPPYAVQTTAYDEMLAAGGLQRVQDAAARQALVRFHAGLQTSREQTDYFRLHAAEPLPVDDPRVTVGFDPDAKDWANYAYDRPALCRDRGFQARVARAVRDHRQVSTTRDQLTSAAIEVCVRLGRALGRSCTPTEGGPLQGADAAVAKTGSGSLP